MSSSEGSQNIAGSLQQLAIKVIRIELKAYLSCYFDEDRVANVQVPGICSVNDTLK